jgi:hypothetical protein
LAILPLDLASKDTLFQYFLPAGVVLLFVGLFLVTLGWGWLPRFLEAIGVEQPNQDKDNERLAALAAVESNRRWWERLRDDPNRPPEVCVCECHWESVAHIIPCCSPCPRCGLPIRPGMEQVHERNCGKYHGPVVAGGWPDQCGTP